MLFVGGGGGLLVQGTLKDLGYNVELIELAKVTIPTAIISLIVACVYFYIKDRQLAKKYGKLAKKEA